MEFLILMVLYEKAQIKKYKAQLGTLGGKCSTWSRLGLMVILNIFQALLELDGSKGNYPNLAKHFKDDKRRQDEIARLSLKTII